MQASVCTCGTNFRVKTLRVKKISKYSIDNNSITKSVGKIWFRNEINVHEWFRNKINVYKWFCDEIIHLRRFRDKINDYSDSVTKLHRISCYYSFCYEIKNSIWFRHDFDFFWFRLGIVNPKGVNRPIKILPSQSKSKLIPSIDCPPPPKPGTGASIEVALPRGYTIELQHPG